MTEPRRVREAYVYAGRLVRPGDRVNLLLANLMEQDEEVGDYFARKHSNFLREWLGEGPFTISWIGRWPCGRIMLYLKGAKCDEAGTYASDFM